MQICLLTKRKIRNWHIYGQAYHFMLRTAMTNYTHNCKGLAAGCHSKKILFLFRFVQLLPRIIHSNLEVCFTSALYKHRVSHVCLMIICEEKYEKSNIYSR